MKFTAWAAILAISLLAFPQMSRAYTVTCPDPATCHGNIYTVDITNTGVNEWELAVSMTVTTDYAMFGTLGSDLFNGIYVKMFADSFSLIGGTFSYSGPNAPTAPDQISLFELSSGGGCSGPGGFGHGICFWAGEDTGTTVVAGDVYQWTVGFNALGINDTATLKFLYLAEQCSGRWQNNCRWQNAGSLGSFTIPEPSSLALLGLALVLMGAFLGGTRWRRTSLRIR